ncbi:STAS domain-containing protein [Streptomyces gilvus]|uniref:STAS domain-containing protein n=1 Tax=Streptomyces gilvus TaxID=2920937 RepID=UPI001F0F8725|nr:STAS domain-containing protein [Streptomyces sp. CME 23]MCH5676767.1 STAS domain-containing protein [Streptomyces sp. CME 23]
MGVRSQIPLPTEGASPWLTVSPLPECHGLRVAGEVGLATRADWERALERAVREGGRVYRLELSAVTFVDVAGAGALAAAAQTLEEGRRIVLQQPPPTLRRLLDMFWPGLPAIEVHTP